MQFKDIPGYDALKQELIRLARSGAVPHGMLFDYADGMPALHMAWAWAQYLNCEHPTEQDSCGTCPSCQKIARLAHPDLFFSYPVVGAAKEDHPDDLFRASFHEMLLSQDPYLSADTWTDILDVGQSQPIINVRQVEGILERLAYSISEARYRVGIIYRADTMNEPAANKFLKELEEPPERTVFILLSFKPEALLETILSRVQRFEWPTLSQEETQSVLLHYYPDTPPEALEEAVRYAQGHPYDALVLRRNPEQLQDTRREVSRLLQALLERDVAAQKLYADEMAEHGRVWCIALLTHLAKLTEQLLHARYTGQAMPLARAYPNPELLAQYFHLLGAPTAGQIYNLLQEAVQDIRGNVLSKLVLFNTFTLMTQTLAQAAARV